MNGGHDRTKLIRLIHVARRELRLIDWRATVAKPDGSGVTVKEAWNGIQ